MSLKAPSIPPPTPPLPHLPLLVALTSTRWFTAAPLAIVLTCSQFVSFQDVSILAAVSGSVADKPPTEHHTSIGNVRQDITYNS